MTDKAPPEATLEATPEGKPAISLKPPERKESDQELPTIEEKEEEMVRKKEEEKKEEMTQKKEEESAHKEEETETHRKEEAAHKAEEMEIAPTVPPNRTILVLGATGQQGNAVATHLLNTGKWTVRIMTRDATQREAKALAKRGAQVFEGDFTKEADMRAALKDVYGIFTVFAPWLLERPEQEAEVGKRVHTLAKEAGVQHVVYSSVAAPSKTGITFVDSKAEIEEHLKGLGFKYWTVIRPVAFMENLLHPDETREIREGLFTQPMKADQRLQMVSVDDIGGIVWTAFEKPDVFHEKMLDFAGDDKTMKEYAQILECKFEEMSLDEVEDESLRKLYEWYQREGFKANIEECKKLYPKLTPFQEWAAKHKLKKRSKVKKHTAEAST